MNRIAEQTKNKIDAIQHNDEELEVVNTYTIVGPSRLWLERANYDTWKIAELDVPERLSDEQVHMVVRDLVVGAALHGYPVRLTDEYLALEGKR